MDSLEIYPFFLGVLGIELGAFCLVGRHYHLSHALNPSLVILF